jgi:hypothetical protein
MWIENDKDGTVELKLPWMDAPIGFNSNNTAQVPEAVGERLCEEIDSIHPRTDDSDESGDSHD